MVDRHHPGKAPTALLQLLADGACLTMDQVEERLDLTRRQISNAAGKLHNRRYMVWLGPGRYQLNEAGMAAAAAGEVITSGPTKPFGKPRRVRNCLRQRAWWSIRGRRRFTLFDLIVDAATAADRAPENNLSRYVRRLAEAGYLAALPNRKRVTYVHKVWVLLKDTGPAAPIVLRDPDAIHDCNTGEVVPCARP